jgi:4-hydroxybenzoate polyprenyltransferase
MSNKGKVRAWLELVRLPNLLTAPGDPIAGLLFAGAGMEMCLSDLILPARILHTMLLVALPSLLLYAGGLIYNDLCDLEKDRQRRPGRPLPSGTVSPGAARAAAVILMLAGLAVAGWLSFTRGAGWYSFGVAMGLFVCVIFYNCCARRIPGMGAMVMGLCRGLSFFFGATFMLFFDRRFGRDVIQSLNPNILAIAAMACAWALYIATVTNLASRETEKGTSPLGRWLPAAVLSVWTVSLFLHKGGNMETAWYCFGTYGIAFLCALGAAFRLGTDSSPEKVMDCISLLIRNILLLQAAVCFTPPAGMIPAMTLLALWFIHAGLSRTFAAT